ncbi:MAG TPA: thiolase family protein [Caldithrix sp.]|nr:thiolase family protein [Caldithrix sp.]
MSYRRALEAQKKGWFDAEIPPLKMKTRKGETIVKLDDEPANVKFDKIPSLRAAFVKEGTVTAANSSKLNDGASALVVMAAKMAVQPLARIVDYSTASKDPAWFTAAPADAISRLLEKTGLTEDDIDLYEINEAFAVVVLAVNQIPGLDVEKVNIAGGAVALGHPIGASGARILTTLLHNLMCTGGKRGIASLCIGGGEAVAVLVEMM